MRRMLIAVLLVGCHRDLTVNPCSQDPAACEETGADTAITLDSASEDSAVETAVSPEDSTSAETAIDSTPAETAADSTSAETATDSAPPDTCVCTPGETVAVAGACPGALEKKTKTCSAGCVWGAELCALPKGWTAIADAPSTFDGRVFAAPVWTGGELIVFGGGRSIEGGTPFGDGAMYRPVTNSWTLLTMTGAPSARIYHSAVFDGRNYIVWGGKNGSTNFGDGIAFDTLVKTWTPMPASPLSARNGHVAVWSTTTNQMLVWGGDSAAGLFADGAAYDPAAGAWTTLPAAPIAARTYATAVWTGTEMLVWGGQQTAGPLWDGALYNPVKKTWRSVSAATLTGRFGTSIGQATDRVAAFAGATGSGTPFTDGATLDVSTLGWSVIAAPASSLYEPRVRANAWISGGLLFVWSGFRESTMPAELVWLATGASYDFAAKTWAVLPTVSAPPPRVFATIVTAPSFALLWSGLGRPGGGVIDVMKDGAIYVP
jgi:N-acetylneuraminic acid mutarotase